MPTIVPERTIDSLFAFETISALPTARIWSPANNSGPGTPDHVVSIPAGSFVFELKTLSSSKSGSSWYVDVPRGQLNRYVGAAPKTIYVLPAEPYKATTPWVRKCSVDPDNQGRCKACFAPSGASDPVSQRRWAGRLPRWSNAALPIRLQPWFSHWAWCMSAVRLHNYLVGGSGFGQNAQSWHIPAQDAALANIPDSIRLCHLLPQLVSYAPNMSPAPDSFIGEPSTPFDAESEEPTSPLSGTSEQNPDLDRGSQDSVDHEMLGSLRWNQGGEIEQSEDSRLVVLSL